MVSALPHAIDVPLTLEDTLLLLATDGVTDVPSYQQMVDVALDALTQVCMVLCASLHNVSVWCVICAVCTPCLLRWH